MTVAAKSPFELYDGDGVTTAFAVRWRYLDVAHLLAEKIAANGTVTVLVNGTDYTATAAPTDAGGTLTLTTALAAGEKLRIRRKTPLAQPTQYPTSGSFPASSHELALDRLTLQGQEAAEQLARTPQVPVGETAPELNIAAIAPGQVLALVGNKIQGVDNDPASAADSAAQALADRILAQDAREAAIAAQEVTEDARDETVSARDEALNYGDARLFRSWAEASAATFAAAEYAMVISTDTGTHTDPVVGGTVNNAGVYRYSSSPAGLERVGDLQGEIARGWAEKANTAVPFLLRSDLIAAPGAADGYGATVTVADTGTHTAVSGEVALGGAAATVGAAIPNEGRYTRVSGAWLRTGDTDRQGAAAIVATINGLLTTNPDGLTLLGQEMLAVFRDAAGNGLAGFRESDGAFIANLPISVGTANGLSFTRQSDGSYRLSLGSTDGILPVGGMTLDATFDSDEDLFVLTDVAKNIILRVLKADGSIVANFTNPEVTAARGSRSSLSARLAVGLTPYGRPKGEFFGLETLVETHRRLRTRKRVSTAQWVGASIGDSWTHANNYWMRNKALQMRSSYGNAGPGWVGFGYPSSVGTSLINGNVDADPITGVTIALSGTVTPNYNNAASPDLSSLSMTAGATVTINYNPSANLSLAKLLYAAGAGAIEYRWNGTGAYTALSLASGSGLGTADLAGLPTGAWSLELRCTADCEVMGIDLQSTASGARLHKLGGTGSRAQQWAGVNAAQWQAGLAALAPNYVQILLGTNDQAVYGASQFAAYVQTMIDRVRAAVPLADILLATPPENGLGRSTPMSDYANAMGDLAAINGCAYVDLQPCFGKNYAEYGYGSARGFFVSDHTHPSAAGGDAVLDTLMTALRA